MLEEQPRLHQLPNPETDVAELGPIVKQPVVLLPQPTFFPVTETVVTPTPVVTRAPVVTRGFGTAEPVGGFGAAEAMNGAAIGAALVFGIYCMFSERCQAAISPTYQREEPQFF